MTAALDIAVLVFVACLGLNWPELPGNARLPELLFIPFAALACIVWWRDRTRVAVRGLDLLVIVYVAGALPSLMVTDDLRASGIELMRNVYLAAIYGVIAIVTLSGRALQVARGFRWSAVLHAAVGLAAVVVFAMGAAIPPALGEVMKMPYVGAVLRLRALTYSPSMLGALLTATMPFVAVAAVSGLDPRPRRWSFAAAVVCAAILLTFSHTVAGFMAAALFVTWPLLVFRRPLRLGAVAAVILVAVFFNLTLTASVRSVTYSSDAVTDATVYPYAVDGGQASIGPAHVDYEVMSYFRIKQLALQAFLEHPLTGVGLDRFHRVSEAAYQNGRLPGGYREIDPHSALLGRLAETGLSGGITLVALWVGAIAAGTRLLRGREAWLARAAVAALIGLLINSINIDIMNFRFFWAGLGLLRGLGDQTDA